MKSCEDVDALMTPYVDGEAAVEETAAVDAHLADCPPCRARASAERAAREVLQARSTALGERASAGLRARCVAATSDTSRVPSATAFLGRRVAGWVPLSLAATLVLAVGGVFFVGQNDRLEVAFAAQLALDHDRCFSHLEETTSTFDRRAAEARLASEHGLELTVPDETSEFDLIDVRQCLYDEGEMAHILCEWQGEPVSLFVVPERGTREQQLEIMGHDALTWTDEENAYVLVADQGPVDVNQLQAYVRRYTD